MSEKCVLTNTHNLADESVPRKRLQTFDVAENCKLITDVPERFRPLSVHPDFNINRTNETKLLDDEVKNNRAWKLYDISSLPTWLQSNDFLHKGHRPPLQSFSACFRSIFKIHTETINIWTHLIGCLIFVGIAASFLSRSDIINWEQLVVFAAFFAGAIICLGMSFLYHTLHCHSELVEKYFSRLDYCGIALLIVGSFVPWIYYGFYCDFQFKVIYLLFISVLGMISIIASMYDKLNGTEYRKFRACIFAGFGLIGIVPVVHYMVVKGFLQAVYHASLGWLCLMAVLYLLGAALYASRIPERFFPGKCDIWFHSHQIFHVLVIAAAFVHYCGISKMANHHIYENICK